MYFEAPNSKNAPPKTSPMLSNSKSFATPALIETAFWSIDEPVLYFLVPTPANANELKSIPVAKFVATKFEILSIFSLSKFALSLIIILWLSLDSRKDLAASSTLILAEARIFLVKFRSRFFILLEILKKSPLTLLTLTIPLLIFKVADLGVVRLLFDWMR